VEYTFKNSLSEKAITIILGPTGMVLQSPEREEMIGYDQVTSVKLSRLAESSFRIRIGIDAHPPIVVTNRYFLPSGEFEDRSREYSTFVRLLHFHLKTKSAPVYTSGKSLRLVVIWGVVSAFAAFFVSFVSEYLGMSVVDPFIQASILTAFILAMIFLINKGKLPKEYSPEDIPLQFLP
jgi:hypothetical protein